MPKHTVNRYEPRTITLQLEDGHIVNIQTEPFWRNRPNLWFQKIEAQLENNDIDDEYRKYKFVISLLDEETALEVKDIIINPPCDDDQLYDTLKKQLIKRVTAKNEEEAKKRMMAEPMGDRKPSEFYSHLNIVASCYVRDTFVQEVWLECLPQKIRSVLECLKDHELAIQMKVADSVYEVFYSPPTKQPTDTPSMSELYESLLKEVENLNKVVQKLKPIGKSCRARSKDRDSNCIQTSDTPKPKKIAPSHVSQHKPCQYHTKYGVKLCKMRKNCN